MESVPKPYLRKGGGVTGKYMKLVSYPLLRKSSKDCSLSVHDSESSKASEQAVNVNLKSCSQGVNPHIALSPLSKRFNDIEIRPVTAETADSGYPEDENVILSDRSGTNSQPTVSCDVSDISNHQTLDEDARPSAGYDESGSFQSVIPDVASSSASGRRVFLHDAVYVLSRGNVLWIYDGSSYGLKQSLFNSTAEFELVEAEINACNNRSTTPLNCSQSSSLKAVKSKIDGQRKTAVTEKDCGSEYSVLSVPTLLNNGTEKISEKQFEKKTHSFSSLDRISCQNRLKKLLDVSDAEGDLREPVRQAFPEPLGKQINDLNVEEDKRPSVEPGHLSFKDDLESHVFDRFNRDGHWQETGAGLMDSNELTTQQKALAKQLRDLIMCLDIAFEKNTESEQLKISEINRLKRELATLKKVQKNKQDEESEIVKLLKEQVKDLRSHGLELGRKLTEEKSRKRAVEIKSKGQDKIIAQLKEENEKLISRLKIISGQKAEVRGRNAEEILSQKALRLATGRAPVTAFSKRTNPPFGFIDYNSVGSGEMNIIPLSNSKNTEKETCTISNASSSDAQLKTVHWNEPVATTADTQDASFPLTKNMHVMQTEDSTVGRTTLYRSLNGEFVSHTQTFCKCNFYEYMNGDTRWIDSMKKYQAKNLALPTFSVYYYAGVGATTVESMNGDILIRHFLKGQLEIYRSSGEITLVTCSGKRIETIKQPNSSENSFRVEMFDDSKNFRVIYKNGEEVHKLSGLESCFRADGSFAVFVECDDSIEFRGAAYAVRRFKNGDVKIRLTEIDTSISLLVADVGTVKHHLKPACCSQRYCVEWGKVARERFRRFHLISHRCNRAGV
uniref:TMF_TATA_bd domain-containing protein n=1 Tax=Syphacia muris TaxID=451379 RepID=A0A158R490_9BILA